MHKNFTFPNKQNGHAHATAWVLFFLAALLVFALDQLSKFWIVNNFYPGESVPFLGQILYLTYVRNPGAAFGLFAYKTSFFIAISAIMVILTIISAFQIPPRLRLLRYGLAALMGGVTGNLYDRLQTGYVVDFLDLRFWPVFNVADIAIVVGVFMIAFGMIMYPHKPGPESTPQEGG